jgi:hypothetical protein
MKKNKDLSPAMMSDQIESSNTSSVKKRDIKKFQKDQTNKVVPQENSASKVIKPSTTSCLSD